MCEQYDQAQQLVSCDEKTCIQALQKLHLSLPMRVGNVECQRSEYKRHGALSRITDVWTYKGCPLRA